MGDGPGEDGDAEGVFGVVGEGQAADLVPGAGDVAEGAYFEEEIDVVIGGGGFALDGFDLFHELSIA
ncbi:hypothetical protein FWH13_00565 [Candidatus Saccharibacteria bacterium]|nr:hypothetical protein [Candidatus Saccharibacteria bacterium]